MVTSPSPATFNLVALAAEGEERVRLVSAFADRRVEILDAMLSGTRDRTSVVAVVGPDRMAEIFIGGNGAGTGGPRLDDTAAALANLLRFGCFEEGAALVLGRRHDPVSRHASDYPELLRLLASDPDGRLAGRCAAAIAGIGVHSASLVSTILWWELARATRRDPNLTTLHALRLAGRGFSALRAPWQTGLASSARRRAERVLQTSLLEEADALEIEPLRFEVVPALLVACDASSPDDWAAPCDGTGITWRHLGQVRVDLDDGTEPDVGSTPLVLRHLDQIRRADGLIDVEVAVDFQVRIALGLHAASRRERIRYSLVDDGTFFQPRSTVARAGELVLLRCDPDALRREPVLTCTSTLGHFASFDLVERGVLRTNDGPRDSHALSIEIQAT